MAKISPVSIKYMIHATFSVEGALEKPDVIGAIFGQTEGLLGAELEMRELQKEGKIGRIEVELERSAKRTTGTIKIPTALDQSETTLIAAAVETIERIGPCDSQLEVERIEDVRGSKRDYIIERAKKLMLGIQGASDSREISNEIKDSAKMANIKEYGKGKLPSGDLSGNEVIVVEGRADVLNLLRNGVNNVISMNGTKLPEDIIELSKEKEITLFVDGDRGGKLIVKNVADNANIKYVATAPDGKEVEELTGKEILMNLRKKVPVRDFLSIRGEYKGHRREYSPREERKESREQSRAETPQRKIELTQDNKTKLKEISTRNGNGKALLLDGDLKEITQVPVGRLSGFLKRPGQKPSAMIIDGMVTNSILRAGEDSGVSVIAAKKFASANTSMQLLNL